MRASLLRIGVFTATMLVATGAFAQATDAERAACTPDVLRLCASHIPDVAGIKACLRAQKAALSGSCREVINASERGPRMKSASAQ